MPSQITHLAIAKKYLEKHPGLIRDVQRFLDGSVLPDLDPNKERSHCGVRAERVNIVKRNLEKVDPQKFLATHDLQDDLNKGWYLHLYVDYQYYNIFLKNYFQRVSFGQSSIDMYETTRRDDKYLMEQYQVSYQDASYASELAAINHKWDQEHERRHGHDYAYEIPYGLPELDAFVDEMSAFHFVDK